MTDVPRLFIVRYKRNFTEDNMKVETKPKNIWDTLQGEDVDPASQLVARYNGSDEILQVKCLMGKLSSAARIVNYIILPYFTYQKK